MGKKVIRISKEDLGLLVKRYKVQSRQIPDNKRRRSIKEGDTRYSNQAPREIIWAVRVSPVERYLIEKRFGGIAGLRDYGLNIIQEESGDEIDVSLK